MRDSDGMRDVSAIRWHMTVTGRVQGVGYRYAVVMAARRIGAVGWVRNRYDGSVECEAQGTRDQLDRLVAAMRAGSQWSRVADIAIDEIPALTGADAETAFSVRR